jgi:manganese/zinc/iron transport system permease protein
MSNAAIIQIVGALVAVACALPGVFLVLRRSAMVSDAISHSVLFGIVVGFIVFSVETTSPILILTAAASGVLTVWLVELLVNTKRVSSDAAIGLVFPVLFSIGVVLINTRLQGVHIDIDAVLLGSITFAPINTMGVFGLRIPEGFVVMGGIMLLNIGLIALFYKELKLSTFDPGLAAALGFSPTLLHYGLMTAVSMTAVGAFDHVGAILVVAFMIAPPAAAYLLTDRLDHMLLLSALIGVASAVAGYWVSRLFGVNISGMMATMTGVFFLLALVFAPQRGLLARRLEAIQRRRRFAVEMLLVHLASHEGTPEEAEENSVSHLREELAWAADYVEKTVRRAVGRGFVTRHGEALSLTDEGRIHAERVTAR